MEMAKRRLGTLLNDTIIAIIYMAVTDLLERHNFKGWRAGNLNIILRNTQTLNICYNTLI